MTNDPVTVSPAEQVERAERWIDLDGGYAEKETAQLVIELAGTLRLALAVVEALQELRAAEAVCARLAGRPDDQMNQDAARVAQQAKAFLDAALAAFDASSAGAEKETAA